MSPKPWRVRRIFDVQLRTKVPAKRNSLLCNNATLAYYSRTMKPRDPEAERRRLAEYYESLTEGELRQIAEDPASLTPPAIAALNYELARRSPAEKIDVGPESPPRKESIPEFPFPVIVRRFRDLPEALLAKAGVESADIECFLYEENIVRLNWMLSNLVGEVKLVVSSEDSSDAAEIFEQEIPAAFDVEGVGEYRQPRCPRCDSMDITFHGLNRLVAYISMWFGVPIPLAREGWKCFACGHEWTAASDNVNIP